MKCLTNSMFDVCDSVDSLISSAVLSKDTECDMLEHPSEAEKSNPKFVEERIIWGKSVKDKRQINITKLENFPIYKQGNQAYRRTRFNGNINDRIKKRKEINLPELFGNFQLCQGRFPILTASHYRVNINLLKIVSN